MTIQKYPERSPIDAIGAIKHLIKSKSICDIGCGSGDLLNEILKQEISVDVYGVELLSWKIPKSRPYITCGDYTAINLPQCQVYMLWLESVHYKTVVERLPSGSMVIDLTSKPSHEQRETFLQTCTLLEVIDYSFNETEFGMSSGYTEEKWPLVGTRKIFVYRKN